VTFSTHAGSIPRSSISLAVRGTPSGSLTPQSAELSTISRSGPYFRTISTIRSEPIFVCG